MIRDLYAEQLDDFGKPVQGGYEMQRTTPEPSPAPVEQPAKPKTFSEAVQKAAPTQKTQPSDAQIASVAKQMKQTPDLVRKMMKSDPKFAKQIGETKIEGGETPAPEAPDAPEPQAPTPPPVESAVQESLAIGPDNFLTDYGQRAKGQDAQLEDHLEKAGIFQDATPQQLSQFAEMLGIPQFRFVSTPEQLRGAILLNNAEANLRQVLTNAGIVGIKDPEPEKTAAGRMADRAKKAAGEFGEGFMEKSGIGSLKNVAKAVGRAATRGRFAATAEDDAPAQSWDTMTPLERAMYEDEDDYNAQQTYGKKEVDKIAETYAATNREARNPFFEDAAYDKADTGYKSRRKVVDMSIDDFLRMAEKLDTPNPESEQVVNDLLQQGKPFSSLPTLMFDNDGQGVATVKGHEGRHRGMGLASRGEKTMPVVLESVGRNPIRWSEQGDTKNFDRIKGKWPSKLRSQTEGSGEEMDFPVSDPSQKYGIEMPSKEIDNKDAGEGDQLGLFEGTGKKNTKSKKFKLENEKDKAKQTVMFDRMNDHPDQKSLFSSFGEAADHYAAQLKKK